MLKNFSSDIRGENVHHNGGRVPNFGGFQNLVITRNNNSLDLILAVALL